MRLHTHNRREIQKLTKSAKLRGVFIGGGGKSLTASGIRPMREVQGPRRTGPAPIAGVPDRMLRSSPLALGALNRRSKRGDRAFWVDSCSIPGPGGTPAYVRTATGAIQKAGA